MLGCCSAAARRRWCGIRSLIQPLSLRRPLRFCLGLANLAPLEPMALHELTLDKLQHFNLLTPTTITATGNQTGIDLTDYEGDVQLILTNTAAGAGATLTFRIEESADNSTYTAATGGGFTAVANAVGKQVITLNSNDLKRYIRLSCSAATGTPSSVVACVGFGLKKYG